MGLRRRTNGEVLTASAEPLGREPKASRRVASEWQRRAWEHYDKVGELHFAINYTSNALGRVRLFPATQPDPNLAPKPLEDARANAEMDRLRGDDGSHASIISRMAQQLMVPGEGYLVAHGPEGSEGQRRETWEVFSTVELEKRSEGWYLKDSPLVSEGVRLENPTVSRFWRPHPTYRLQPDSSLKPLRDALDELLILDQLYRSNARSRIAAGLFLIPDEVNLRTAKRPGMSTGDGQGAEQDPFVNAMVNALVTPVTDEDSVANVAPGVIKVKSEFIEKFRHLTFARDFDKDTAARYDRVMQRIAAGIDLPNEVINGISELNHWSAWLVDEDAFDSHLAPLVELICSSLTKIFLRPALGKDDVIVWYDASALLTHPNKAADADTAHERMVISDEAYRRYKGFSEDDVPDEAEIARRIELAQELKSVSSPDPKAPVQADNVDQGTPSEDGTPTSPSHDKKA